jgi:hypothetical protein
MVPPRSGWHSIVLRLLTLHHRILSRPPIPRSGDSFCRFGIFVSRWFINVYISADASPTVEQKNIFQWQRDNVG